MPLTWTLATGAVSASAFQLVSPPRYVDGLQNTRPPARRLHGLAPGLSRAARVYPVQWKRQAPVLRISRSFAHGSVSLQSLAAIPCPLHVRALSA